MTLLDVILDVASLASNGTKFSNEFAEFLKKNLDQTPVTAKSLGRSYMIDGGTLEHAYKYKWSNFERWEQRDHAHDWVLLPGNLGERLSIDETCLQDDLFYLRVKHRQLPRTLSDEPKNVKYELELLSDILSDKNAVEISHSSVSKDDALSVTCSNAGGFVARISPI